MGVQTAFDNNNYTGSCAMKWWLMPGLALGIIAAPAGAQQKLGEVEAPRSPDQIYAKVCGYCHGRNVGPVILGRHLPPQSIKYVARHGQNGMPAFRPSEVTPSELDALANWISAAPARKEEHGQ
jgi:mono/diheme cytochrome c family protein